MAAMSVLGKLREVQRLGGDAFSSYEVIGLIGQAADEIERQRAALMEIATDEKIYLGHGDYKEEPLPNDYCQNLARKALDGT